MALIGILNIRAAKALVSLHICAGSPESSLLHNVTCTKSHIFYNNVNLPSPYARQTAS